MVRKFAVFALMLAFNVSLFTTAASAALDFSTGIRKVVQEGPISDCNAKAKAALEASLVNPGETQAGTGQWIAYGPPDAQGLSSAAAAIHCFPVDNGYVVTFTCAIEYPPSVFRASELCKRLSASFSGREAAALPTPTPVPTGCSLTNLVGTWMWNDKNNMLFTFNLDGSLLDADGVSGNWNLDGNKVTLTYYGTNTATLSPDGKHLSGPNRNFTRKC